MGGYQGGGGLRAHNHSSPSDGGVLSNPTVTGDVKVTAGPDDESELARLTDLARANLLINPNFRIWQRGNTFNPVSNDAWTADRWKAKVSGTITPRVTKTNNRPYFNDIDARLAWNAGAAGAAFWIEQDLEEFAPLKGRTVALCVVGGFDCANARISIDDGVGETMSGFVPVNLVGFEFPTVIRTIDPAATRVRIKIGFLQAGDVPAAATGIDVGGAFLATGDVAVRPRLMVPAEDLARCRRFYESLTAFRYTFNGTAASGYALPFRFSAEKSAAPAMTVNAGTKVNLGAVSSEGVTLTGFTLTLATVAAGLCAVGNSADDASWTAEVA